MYSILSRRHGHGFEADERHVCSQGDEVQLFEPDDLALVILHEDDIIAGFFAQVFLIGVSEPYRQVYCRQGRRTALFSFPYLRPFLDDGCQITGDQKPFSIQAASNRDCPTFLTWSIKEQDIRVSDALFDHIGIAQCFFDLVFMVPHVPVLLTDNAFPIFIGRPNSEAERGLNLKPDGSHALL